MPQNKNIPTDRMGKYLASLDFKLLKKQKTDLIKLQTKLDKIKGRSEKNKVSVIQNDVDTLEGIINMIDSIQDIAVDEYGYKERKVFKLSRKD